MFGWKRDEEDFDFLRTRTAKLFSAPKDFVPPKTMSFRNIIRVENQGPMGSCVGHGGSSGMECLAYLSAGVKIQLSRMFCYLQSQRATGIRGDNGATIAGCVKALANIGICQEAEMPYPNPIRYNPNIPQSAVVAAQKHKILGHQDLNSAQEVFDWISQGKGPVIFGMDWYDNVSNSNGLVTANMLRGGSGGGHCNIFMGYSGELGSDGKPLIDDLNSHGTGSGNQGWFQWTWGAVDELARQERNQRSIIGITDITGFDPARLINFASVV